MISGNLYNYERIKNILNFKKKKLIREIGDFLNDNIKNKYRKLIDIIENKKNEMTLIYKNNEKVKLFGKKSIENNKNNCFFLINNNIYELMEYYNLDKNKQIIKIKLIENNKIINMNFMFNNCSSLLSIKDISK